MPTSRRDYYFTHHLRERFLQRTNKRFFHIQFCREKDCKTCDDLKQKIKHQLRTNRKLIDIEIARRLDLAIENRSYVNNSGFMAWYYDKYGYDKRFQFLIHKDILFVVVIDNGKKIIVTCVLSKTHIAGKNALKPKFKKA